MSAPKKPETSLPEEAVNISRHRMMPIGWSWVWLFVVLTICGAIIVGVSIPANRDARARPADWATLAVEAPIAIGGLVLIVWILVWATYSSLFLAKRPLKKLLKGDLKGAERCFEKALAKAWRFKATDPRRGVMLFELANYLVYRARRSEAKAMLEESIAILEKSTKQQRINYFIALNNFAIFHINVRDFESGQRILETALDSLPAMKKDDVQSPDLELLLRLNLMYLFLKVNDLEEAKLQREEARPLLKKLARRNRRVLSDTFLGHECLWNCAAGQYDVAWRGLVKAYDPNQGNLLWARGKIHLARREYARAEEPLRKTRDAEQILGVPPLPESLEPRLDLAESLFGQAKHDEAFAVVQEARAIVADFAIPRDPDWRRTLATWLQRAKDLDKAELAASLQMELDNAAVAPVQAITILEKFRLHRQAPG